MERNDRLGSAARSSEAELGEEPPVLAGLEPLLEARLGGLARGHLLVPGGQRVGAGGDVLEVDVEGVAGGHEVGEVYELHEALDARLLGRLLGRVLADHLLGVLGQAGDEAVAVGAVAGALLEHAHDHSLPAGEAALQQDHCLTGLQELHHRRRAAGVVWGGWVCVCVCCAAAGWVRAL
jgi:hypothetical protein